ncbi:helix-turn-helix domain-containing protein [Paenibacillus tarimensis]
MRSEYAIPDIQFQFQLHGTHYRTVEPGWMYPEHNHHFLEINLVTEGRQAVNIDGKERIQQSGDILIIKPGVPHSSRCIGNVPMTYQCVHLDIDDEVLYPLINRLNNVLFPEHSTISEKLRPYLQRIFQIQDDQSGAAAEARIATRIAILQVIVVLAEWASSVRISDFKLDKTDSPLQLRRLRERNGLEKKVRELMIEGSPEETIDESAFPPYRWIGMYSIRFPDIGFWSKPDRFMAKIILQKELESLGTVVTVVEEPSILALIFSDHFAVPPMEEYAARCKTAMEQKLHTEVESSFGGMTTLLQEVGRLYKQCERHMKSDGTEDDSPTFDFVHRDIRAAMQYIEANYTNPHLSLARMAKILDITPNYLSSLFTSQTGLTFSQHLITIRLHHAKQMLRETNLKIYEIAQRSGYSDAAYFSRLFKSTFGISPNKYKASMSSYT